MAETLGIVAGGIGIASFAIQIGDSVMKLSDFWNAVQDASEEVKYLIQEIETLSLVLSEIGTRGDNEIVEKTESVASKKCLDLCRRGAEILSTVVKEAELEISKRRRVGSVKMVLKKASLDKLRDRLKAVQFMLMLSNQTYSEAIQKRRHELQRQWAEHHQQELGEVKLALTKKIRHNSMISGKSLERYVGRQPPLTSEPHTWLQENNSEQDVQRVTYSGKRRKRLIARLSTPAWLPMSRKPWEVCFFEVRTGWKFTAQPYRVVPRDSPIMELAENGDLQGVQELFEKNLASPYDRCIDGETVLDVAAFSQQLEMCRFLMNEGADPDISECKSAIIKANLGWCLRYGDGGVRDHVDLVRCLAQKSGYDFIEELSPIYPFVAIPESFEFLLNHSSLSYRVWTHQECFFVASRLVAFGCHRHVATLIRIAFGNRKIDQQITSLKDEYGSNLLHYVARYLGEYHTAMIWRDWMKKVPKAAVGKSTLDRFVAFWSRWDQFELEASLVLVRDLVMAGSGLFECNMRLFTPLLSIFNGLPRAQNISIVEKFSNKASILGQKITAQRSVAPIRVWLQRLVGAGVDLMDYGRIESQLHREGRVKKEWDFYDDPHSLPLFREKAFSLRLISFTYGPTPDDWQFWLTETMDNSFVEFWQMIDHPEQAMPGAWPASGDRSNSDTE